MEELSGSMLWFFLGYVLVLFCGVLHTVFNVHVMRLPARTEKGVGEAYNRTRRYHPIYNLIIFCYTGWSFMRTLMYPSATGALQTGLVWVVIAALLDMLLAVIIRHPFRQTWREFYIEYQPWLTLSYLAIFIGPLLGFVLLR